jgi:hypothetical protein
VVERTLDARFDGVTLHRIFAALELQQLSSRRGTRSPRREARAKDVSDFDQLGVATYRTGLARLSSDVARGAKQLRVSVTDVLIAQEPGGDLGEERVAYEPELDHGPVGGARAESLIHYG